MTPWCCFRCFMPRSDEEFDRMLGHTDFVSFNSSNLFWCDFLTLSFSAQIHFVSQSPSRFAPNHTHVVIFFWSFISLVFENRSHGLRRLHRIQYSKAGTRLTSLNCSPVLPTLGTIICLKFRCDQILQHLFGRHGFNAIVSNVLQIVELFFVLPKFTCALTSFLRPLWPLHTLIFLFCCEIPRN